jgi:hypothetical protein
VWKTGFPIGSKGPEWDGELGEREEVWAQPFDGFSAVGKGVAPCH